MSQASSVLLEFNNIGNLIFIDSKSSECHSSQSIFFNFSNSRISLGMFRASFSSNRQIRWLGLRADLRFSDPLVENEGLSQDRLTYRCLGSINSLLAIWGDLNKCCQQSGFPVSRNLAWSLPMVFSSDDLPGKFDPFGASSGR